VLENNRKRFILIIKEENQIDVSYALDDISSIDEQKL
jgi:hypothetical protein